MPGWTWDGWGWVRFGRVAGVLTRPEEEGSDRVGFPGLFEVWGSGGCCDV